MIGIVFATIREARPFLLKLGTSVDEASNSSLFFNLSLPNIIVCICGMGPASAEREVSQLIKNQKIEAIINAGIAGALNKNLQIGEIVNVSKVVNWPASGYYVADGADLWGGLPLAVLLTSSDPVFDSAMRSQLAKLADIVDMEGAAIARVCQKAKIKFSAIKAISDLAEENDRKRLFENIDVLSVKLAEILYVVKNI
ncbi:hypothetical protein HZB07_01630 [Candidatus Saganbacteria bacterium]|nr:hypothetical protein [Candidatus Saganbacteria bacterium]